MMIEPHEEDLIQRDLDGALSDEETAVLGRVLVANPAAAARRHELRRLAGLLLEMVEDPPPSLASAVASRLPTARGRRASVLGFLESSRLAFARPATRRPALAFAAGLVFGGASALLVLSGPLAGPPESGLSATVLPGVRIEPAEVLDEVSFDGAGGVGAVATTRLAEGRLLAEIRIDSAGVGEVEVEFSEGEFAALGFERAGGTEAQVAVEPGRLRMTNARKGFYRLVLEARTPDTSDVRIAVGSGSQRVVRSLKTRPRDKTGASAGGRPAVAATNFAGPWV